MKRKNMISMVTSLALVGVVAVGGTLALLTSQSDQVTNTFTIGTGYQADDFYIDENAVKRDYETLTNYGGYVEDTEKPRGDSINFADVVPGTTLSKDPTLHIRTTAPESWVVAEISGLAANSGKLALQGTVSGWHKLEGGELIEIIDAAELEDGVLYIYEQKLNASNPDTNPVFETVKVNDSLEGGETFTSIVVRGVAVEAVAGSEFDVDTAEAVLDAAATKLS